MRTRPPAVRVAGVDEAGRGPLAGPVVAAAVILDSTRPIVGLDDSKRLRAAAREQLAQTIRGRALAWAVAEASVEIDSLNILHASMLAMQRAVAALEVTPHEVLIDGNRCPVLSVPARAVVGGDALVESISAASILAKVYRDAELVALDAQYPCYQFARHKGYPTRVHIEALRQNGACACHRRSYGPVKAALEGRL